MKTIGVQFEEDHLEALRRLAEKDKRSMGFLIREAIDDYLAKRRRAAEERRRQIQSNRESRAESQAEFEAMLANVPADRRDELIRKTREMNEAEERAEREEEASL